MIAVNFFKMSISSEYDAGPFGHELPNEVNFTSKLLATAEDRAVIVSEDYLNQLITLAFDYVHRRQFSRAKFEKLKRDVLEYWRATQLMKQLNLAGSDFNLFFAGLLNVTQVIGRNCEVYIDKKMLVDDIVRYSKLPTEIINQLMARFILPSSGLNHYFPLYNSGTGNRILSMTWRIDVIISDRHLSKIMEPVVIIDLVFTNSQSNPNARRECFIECRLPAFHRLRFMIATLLKEMQTLEQKIEK